MVQPLLLIVDDEKPTRDALRMALEDHYEVYTAANLAQAQAILSSEPIDLVLTDLRLGGDSGMDILQYGKTLDDPPNCIVMTAYGSVDTAVEAMKQGAFSFVTKPLNLDEVDLLLQRANRTRTLEEENRDLQTRLAPSAGLEKILGDTPEMQTLFTRIRQVAPSRTTVLIEGESGTGKELVAHAIHALSGRPKNKFVAVNCAALSPQLLESELFGHEKGSFTGAGQRRIGRFEQANGGTIFLDEIGEIDASTQVKLLRTLSERTIERVGSNEPIKIDVRVIAATNKNLAAMVREGTFREDLYFRLNIVQIDMPPLRNRKDDIVLLAHAFLKEFCRENGKSDKILTKPALRLLRSYSWPGNVRQLRTAIEHGVVMSSGREIGPDDLPSFLSASSSDAEKTVSAKNIGADAEPLAIRLEKHPNLNLQWVERQTIRKALEIAECNRSEAARLLGISRRTLHRKLAEYPELATDFPSST
ncbi:sigma-54-dependent Fis family transcriptional regulator [Akkermansia glycaniphila]|uniref:sigma-54-dependent transcriptional regulator n=1 Tax=Akkermansia glycaniphila TaxID=1679444 RepID=UPI001C032A9B|nr:sigma-54 dependent transcriptional regulator [Akkermansia glycaniphila]MBT9448860.1 sigma-54-dependent Fis family transcriptional regulator [Akkermansia glycaniphila]